MSKLVALSDGQFTLVDEIDYVEVLNNGPWHFHKKGYARRNLRKGAAKHNERLHQFIAKLMDLEGQIDHKNGDGLDNRRENLRSASPSQNAMNRKTSTRNTSGVKGVHQCKDTGKYKVTIGKQNKSHHIGYYDTLVEASEAYRIASEKHHEEYRHGVSKDEVV